VDEAPKEKPAGKPALWRTFVPSLLILVGTFFFISSACFSDSDSSGGYYNYPYPGCTAGSRTEAPEGALATIVSPTDGQVFGAPDVSGEFYVLVELSANGIEITPASECRYDTGYFNLVLERTDGVGCVPTAVTQTVALGQGETKYVYRLPPGDYELTASVVTSSGLAYMPEVSDSVAFTVEGEPLVIDGGVLCP
jgi:hypothetical protein